MNRRLSLVAVVALVCAPQLFAGRVWHKSVGPAQKEAQAKKQLILVDMFAEWCGWCHRFEREVFPSAAFQDATKDIVLLRLDTEDGKEGTQMARKYAVTSLPTFLVLAPDLSMAGLLRGYAPANDFVESLKDQRNKYGDFMKRANNEAAIAKDPIQRLALTKEFMQRGMYAKAEARLKKLTTEKGIPVVIRDEAFYNLAMTQVMDNRLDDALKSVRALTALSKLGTHVEQSRMLAAQIYLQQGNLLAAANEFRSFRKSYPTSPHVAQIDIILPEIEKKLAQSGQ